jgi:hypothetical protein
MTHKTPKKKPAKINGHKKSRKKRLEEKKDGLKQHVASNYGNKKSPFRRGFS